MYSDNCEIPEEEYYIPIGKAEVKREGTDCTIVSFSKMMKVALSAADELAKDGVQCEVIDLRTIRPLDIDTIVNSVKKTNRLVIVEESWPFGSIASEITFQVQRHAFDYLDAPIKRVTGADSSMHYAPNLVEAYLPNPTKVIAAVRSAL
jgi:pyruvate dehydrogenase E1 component beta subunit